MRTALAVPAVALLGLAACASLVPAPEEAAALRARGAYLVEAGGCHDCHSPKRFTAQGPVPDETRLLSGHRAEAALPAIPAGVIAPGHWGALVHPELTAWAGPWGVSFAANLTPDASGLGPWSENDFIQSMRTGRHAGVGRPVLPPMPWYNYARLSEDDLRALFAYLRSLPAVANQVPAPLPPR